MEVLGKIASIVGGVAPTIATMLGGPLAGAATSILAGALGSATSEPSSILSLLEKGGENITAALQASETTAKEKYAYLTAGVQSDAEQSKAINATMQAENAQGVSWWHWRHLIGYVTLAWLVAPLPFFVACCVILVWRGDVTPLNGLIGAMTATIAWVGICAGLNGYVALDTSRRTSAAMTGTPVSSLLGSIVGAFTRKR